MVEVKENKIYTLTHEQLDTLVKRVLDHFWPRQDLGSWLKYISDEDITEWLGADVAGMKPNKPENYWTGAISLICTYCSKYTAFPSVEELKAHISKEHPKC